jgi:polyhydroxyalkanoate synthesis repressor PhaR
LQQGPKFVKKDTIVIKKYENRRLYDTSASRYVNLEEVAAMVREGADIQVVDAKSGEDVTRVILTQIIVEDARGNQAGLPLELLRQLIVASDHARQDFMMWYLKTAFDAYEKLQDSVQNQLSGMRSAAMAPLEAMHRFFTGQMPSGSQSEKDEEIRELRASVAKLENRLKKRRVTAKLRTQKTPRN